MAAGLKYQDCKPQEQGTQEKKEGEKDQGGTDKDSAQKPVCGCVATDFTKSGKKVNTIADAVKLQGRFNYDNTSSPGNYQQCAALTKALDPTLPNYTSEWQPSLYVKDNCGSIPIGAGVATFNFGGRYGPRNSPGGISGGSHTGIFLGCTANGMQILHQWSGRPAFVTTLNWQNCGMSRAECGDRYYMVQPKGGAKGNPAQCKAPTKTDEKKETPQDGQTPAGGDSTPQST